MDAMSQVLSGTNEPCGPHFQQMSRLLDQGQHNQEVD